MRLNNNDRIITDDDIIMSDGSNSLSDVLSSHLNLISNLQSNVKWIYKYGGVGGTGGSGSGTTLSFSIFASLNNILLKDLSIILDGIKLYPLSIRINNPNGGSFNVKYSYTTKSSTGNDVKLELTIILSIENNYLFETLINLNTNSNLLITVSDGNETKQVGCSYVVTPYEFNVSLVDNNGDEVPEEYFIEVALLKGLNVKLSYVISVSALVDYTYTFQSETIKGSIEDKNNSVLFPIDSELFMEENAGYYSAKILLDVIPEGLEKVTIEKGISFSLIPNNLYMLILPLVGVIYDTSGIEQPYEYTPGYITFDYRIYEGISQNRTYNVTIELNGDVVKSESVIERLQYNIKLFSTKSGENTLKVKVSSTTVYTKTYYFYIQKNSLVLDWFERPSEWTSYYYRITETTPNFSQYQGLTSISQTVNSLPIVITELNAPNVSANTIINTHIAIGLQYNSINSEDPIIFNFYNTNSGSSPVLYIKLSEVIRGSNNSELYIKKLSDANKDNTQNYHLISIYSLFTKRIGTEYYYLISLYIDGILENVIGLLSNSPLLLDRLLVEPVNCFINLLEVDYKQVQEDTLNNCDYDVYLYYLKYKSSILALDVGNETLLLNYLKNFTIGLNGRVTTNLADINNIASNIDTPVLIMTYLDDGLYNSSGGFMEALEKSYGEDGTIAGADMNFQVSIKYSSGKNSVEDIQFPSGFETARFKASLQGSSTKNYRVKNFNLSLYNTAGTDEDDVFLYSPNFEDNNTQTFLPETEFTLKADVVDSSHSNNTSCGKFINKVCRKFSEDIPEDGYYKNYIKNCLDGFPILLFLCHVILDSITLELTYTYYYLGIYNFNLGRSSYYNLGYKDLSVFGDKSNPLLTNAGNSFTFFKISPSLNILKEGLGVAEIQGGDPHFDFSLWDPTVLFLLKDTDLRYMFGDLVRGSNSTELLLLSTISKFVEKVAKSGGYLFDFLKKTRGKYETDNVEEGSGYNAEVYKDGIPTGESKNLVPDYTIQYEKYLDTGGLWKFREKENLGSPILGTRNDLLDLIIPNPDEGKLASLNFQAVSEYYTICMVLGLVDSVMKNLNIKTWNFKNDYTATWYPAFYDMDTCLGINNLGNPITYFAFSDYWQSLILKTVNDVEYPSPVRVYRDFSPHSLGENGYDIPTNYLFTVAKYAKLIFTEDNAYLSLYPLELYAKWRSGTINPSTNEGVLINADSFMNNFFANNVASICPVLVSYNYRSKYLKLATDLDTVWVLTDFNKFKGTRVNKVRDWLDGRLHILDAYFNLNTLMKLPITYRTEDGNWENVMLGSEPVEDITYSGNYNLSNNKDIVILNDIFSLSGLGVQVASNILLLIRCPENSPLQIYNANKSILLNYILGGDKNLFIQFTASGTLIVKMGGSQSWTYLLDINWVSTTGLYINSDKLENITGSSGKFSSLQLITPNVRTIALNSPNYSGSLILRGSDSYPNLSQISISGTKMSLTLDNLNVRLVDISNVLSPTSSIQILNCNLIELLSASSMTLSSLLIEGLKGSLKNFTLNNNNINQVTVKCGEPGGTFTLSNDQTVTSVTVGDFLKVIILNCPNLQKVILNQKTVLDIEELQILNCKSDSIRITSESSQVVGKVLLSTSKLKKILFTNTSGITDVELPDNVELLLNAFSGCSKLKTVSGNNIYINLGAFKGCQQYLLKNKNSTYTNIVIKSTTTSLLDCFNGTKCTWAEVKHFIDNIVPEDNSLINVLGLFRNCNLSFTQSDLKTSITLNNYPNFEKLNKVTDASYIFAMDTTYENILPEGVNAINKKFMDMGSPNGCDYNMAFYNNTSIEKFYIPKNVFSGNISKITMFPFGSATYNTNKIIFTDEQGDPLDVLTPVKLSEIFNPNGQSPSKLTTLLYVNPYEDYIFDWSNVFTSGWTSLSQIRLVCSIECNYLGYENLLLNIPKPISVFRSWAKSKIEGLTANYYTMYNWDLLIKLGKIFTIDRGAMSGEYTNNCNKYISLEDYVKLCEKILSSTTLTHIDCLFRNVTVVGTLLDWSFGATKNTKIISAVCLFENFKNYTDLETSVSNYLPLNKDFCLTIPSLLDVYAMFRYCKIGNPISFNFFKKRQESTEQVWIKKGEEYKQATLYNYSYVLDMYGFTYLFDSCEWDTDCLQYDPSLYEIPRNRASDGDSEYSTYYLRQYDAQTLDYIYIEKLIILNTEITDAENIKGGYISLIPNVITNKSFSGDPNKLIVPPDIFYGLNPVNVDYISLNNAFSCKTPLNGIIPKNLLKANRSVSILNLFKALLIIPQLVDTWEDDENIYNIYVHYPSGFTSNPSLSNAFNSDYIVLANDNSGDKKVINYSLVLLLDSIPKTTSVLSNAFNPGDYSYTGAGLNITTTDHLFNFIGRKEDNTLIFGINNTYFTTLYFDLMFYSKYLSVVNGNIFDPGTDAGYLKMSTTNSRVMYNQYLGSIASSAILPKATKSITHLSANYGPEIKSSQIVDSINSKRFYTEAYWNVVD